MKKNFRTGFALLLVVAVAASILAGCQATPTGTQGEATPTPAPSIKAGMVTDIGGLGDKSFNDLS